MTPVSSKGYCGTLARLGEVPVPRLRVDRGGNSSEWSGGSYRFMFVPRNIVLVNTDVLVVVLTFSMLTPGITTSLLPPDPW